MEHIADRTFTDLLEAAPDAMLCVDVDGRIIAANAQTTRLFGYERHELDGQLVEILVPDTVRALHPRHRARFVADPRSRPMGLGMDLSARRKDGSAFPAEISLSAIRHNDSTLTIATVRDITERLQVRAEREQFRVQVERERLERELQQARRMESLGQLAGGVAHDFNNLLGVISGYAQLMGEEITGELPSAPGSLLDNLDRIKEASRQAAVLTRQLLAFARRDVIKPRPLDLNEAVAGVERLLIRTLGEHIELITELDPAVSAVVADPGQLEQVIINFAVNARDAMPSGGRLAIKTSNFIVTEVVPSVMRLEPGPYASLKVSDTGTGIPKDIIDRVFEPFFTTKADGQGTGLGLATAYGIVTHAGGSLSIYSELGLGTTITALLPATSGAVAEVPVQRVQARDGRGETVLLVEDEAFLRDATRDMLRRHGYGVLTAPDGPTALDVLAHEHAAPVDVLLTDVVMPHMQGRQLAEMVRASYPSVRVLFMSGYTKGLLGSQGILEPGVHLIEKPFDLTLLLTELTSLLSASPGEPARAQPGGGPG